MNFLNLPAWGILSGWLALAGGLYLLQRLRVRHRKVEVPTTMFWRQVVEENRARVFTERFRHPWTYLLLLAIASLLWFAVAGLQAKDRDAQRVVLVLDGSVGMEREGRFGHAKERLLEDAATLPTGQREVWWNGGDPVLLLARGEETLLLEERLKKRVPDLAASTVETWMLQHARWSRAIESADLPQVEVRLYGDAPVREEALALLPDGWSLTRATEPAPAVVGNRGFLAGGVNDALTGKGDRVDLYLEVCGTTKQPEVQIDGEALTMSASSEATTRGTAWRFHDVPARGQLLHFRLPSGDAFPADDTFLLSLPQRRPLRILLSPALRTPFAPVLAADHGLVAVEGEADLVIRRIGEDLGTDLPALVVGERSPEGHAFQFVDHRGHDAESLLQEVHGGLGLHRIDALGIAQALQQPISLGVGFGDRRAVQLWDRLLEPGAGFRSSQAFPLFLGSALRWLADSRSFPTHAVTGIPIASTEGTWTTPTGAVAMTAGLDLVASVAGLHEEVSGRMLAVHAFAPTASLGLATPSTVPDATPVSRSGLPAWSWLVLLALLLLAFEWRAFQKGRIA